MCLFAVRSESWINVKLDTGKVEVAVHSVYRKPLIVNTVNGIGRKRNGVNAECSVLHPGTFLSLTNGSLQGEEVESENHAPARATEMPTSI